MENTNENENSGPALALGWLVAPLAVLLSFAMSQVLGLEFLTAESGMVYGALVAAAILATVPRVLNSTGKVQMSSSMLSLTFLGASMLIAWLLATMTSAGALVALLFLILAVGGHLFDVRGRHEEQTILTFAVIGFMFALLIAGASDTWAGPLQDVINNNPMQQDIYGTPGSDGLDESYLNDHREATGFLFFSAWSIAVLIGGIVAVLQRGVLFEPGTGKWWSYLPARDGAKPNNSEWVLTGVLATWALAHVATLYHFATGDVATRLSLEVGGVQHGHMSYWWAMFTGVVAIFIGYCIAERWYTRAMLAGVTWILYTIGGWQEAGWFESELLEGTQGLFIWAGITFFIFVGVFYIAGHDKYGGWDNRSPNEPSNARQWWSAHWAGLLTFTAFVVALVVRTSWNVIPAMAASGTLGWDMTGGSDPWYMKRTVDYIIAQHAHFIFDADRAYPIGGINPRPPLFAWSLALGGMLAAPFIGVEPAEAVWWSVAGLPALYGALTVFPLAAISRNHIGKGAGVITAWLIALMPGHVSHSTFALADHDAFVLLFLSLGFHYYLKAIQHGGTDRLVKNVSWRPVDLIAAMRAVVREKSTAVGYAILAGMSIATVALGWKGFVYGPGIIFLAFALQVLLNMFRRRDSTILVTLNVIMLSIIFLVPLPFYAHPQLNLIWDASGFQPMFYIAGFTFLLSFVVVAYRDKPWLMVFSTAFMLLTGVLAMLWFLQWLNLYSGWDVLTTGGYYFSKNKIFGTIAEAQAPSRGQLFASFGPLVFIAALSAGVWALWQGLRNRRQTHLVLGLWVLVASMMAWSAGRFIFNATPAMAVLAAWAIIGVWKGSGAGEFSREWRRIGVRTPGERFTATRKALWRTPAFSAIGLIMLMLMSQHATYGLDAGIPRGSDVKDEVDSTIYHLTPDMFRFDIWDFSIMDNTPYDEQDNWYMGSFGPGFNGWGWNSAYDWLSNQDQTLDAADETACTAAGGLWEDDVCHQRFGDRPAFVSWWDYGFQALAQGQHPSVSDNFQSGIPATGNMLLSRSQDDLVALFIWQLSEGDLYYTSSSSGEYTHSTPFTRVLSNHLNAEQLAEFNYIQIEMDKDGAQARTMSIESHNANLVLASGGVLTDGLLNESAGTVWRIYEGTDTVPCEAPNTCTGEDFDSEEQARVRYNQKTVKDEDTSHSTTHHIIGDYWYTDDLIEEFEDVASNLHRKNARLALVRQMLTTVLDSDGINALYSDLMSLDIYDVPDSDGKPGDTFQRNHEIRYFAVDNRLYPIGGRYNEDARYNYGNPTGIFHAPTTLGGQDVESFLKTTYETESGGFPKEMTAGEYEEAYLQDMLNQQQQGADYEPIMLNDIRVDHLPAFFDTMIARTYVGYGASTLGLDVGSANPQPSQHFGVPGSPGTMLHEAKPLPGAMMNHFVIANWYGAGLNDEHAFPDEFADLRTIGYANTQVKVLKYYSGTEVCGQVQMSHGAGMNNTRILVERDAFSGEEEMDMDNNTYWIPIAAVDSDENGKYCVTVPAGQIRFSAYLGNFDATDDKDTIRKGGYENKDGDFTALINTDRDTHPVVAILGGVSNMTWLEEARVNITGEQGHSGERYSEAVDLIVDTSGVSGTVTWAGHETFEGDPLIDVDFNLRSIYSDSDNYTVTTTNGSFTSEENRIVGPGQGEVTFTENGTFVPSSTSESTFVRNFTGTYSRSILAGQTYTGDGKWSGTGTLKAMPADVVNQSVESCEGSNETTWLNNSMGWQICLLEAGDSGNVSTFYFDGSIEASGRMTANLTTEFEAELQGATFEGIGEFNGTGTINGTGTFTGIGTFSGEIVSPGSFYLSGLTPGTYNMIAQLDNGKEVLLPDPVEVQITASYGLELTMPGSYFTDTMLDMDGEIFSNSTFELIDTVLGDDEAVVIETDENGTFGYGPLSKGEYYYRFDLDGDGWYELNSSFEVGDNSEEIAVNMAIPIHYDMNFSISDSALDTDGNPIAWENEGRTVTITSKYDDYPPVNATSDADGLVQIELPRGHWIISDNSNDTHMLWFDYELLEDDVSLGEKSYIHAVNVSGKVVVADDWMAFQAHPDEPHHFTTVSQVNVTMRSGHLVRYDVTDENGVFEARLPAGVEFSITTKGPAGTSTGSALLTVDSSLNYSEDTNMVNLSMEPSKQRTGTLNIFDNETVYDNALPGWKPVEVTVTSNETGVVWSTFTMSNGEFNFLLPHGNFTTEVLNEDLNVPESYFIITDEAVEASLDVQGTPAMTDVQLLIFLDDLHDGVFENGTAVNVSLTLVPVSAAHGDEVLINATHYNISGETGVLNLSLEAGTYDIRIEAQDINDAANRTLYQTVATNPFNPLEVPIGEVEDPILLALEPEWLMTATLKYGTEAMDNATVWLYNQDGANFEKVISDENGSIEAYVQAGNWTAVLPQVVRDEVGYEMQENIIISEATADSSWTWNAVASTNISLKLTEFGTDEILPGFTVTAVSLDGLRNTTIGPTDADGLATGTLTTGDWTLFLNRSENHNRWNIEEGVYDITVSVSDAGANMEQMNITASKSVRLGGMIFWDLDGNGIQNNHEGIPDVIVNVSNGSTIFNLTTDADGVWEVFAPIQTNYNVTVSKDGFETSYYSDGIEVNQSRVSEDLALDAGIVSVYGNLTHVLGGTDVLNSTIIELHPASGLDREMVTASLTMVGDTLNWTADVTPGDWVVWASLDGATETDFSVAIGLLKATVTDGGSLDMQMSNGGWLPVSSEWTDFSLQKHHLGETNVAGAPINGTVTVTVDLGDGVEFDLDIGADGGMELLLPVGQVSLSTEFSTTEMGRQMNYTGGVTTQIITGVTQAEAVIKVSRPASHDISFEVVSISTGSATGISDDKKEMTAIEKVATGNNPAAYQDITVTAKVFYDGNQADEMFILTGDEGILHDSELWNITFLNSSSGEFEESLILGMGIGQNSSDTPTLESEFTFKVELPSQDEARSYDDGHGVGVTFSAGTVLAGELGLTIKVPQNHSITLQSYPEKVGVAPGGEASIDIVLLNTGNGEDQPTFNLTSDNLPEGWSLTPSSASILLSADQERTQTFTVHAPTDGAAGPYTATIRLSDESGQSFFDSDGELVEEITVEIDIAHAELEIVNFVNTGEALYQGVNEFEVAVSNTGTLKAEPVDITVRVSALQDELVAQEINATTSITIPAGETVTATLELDLSDASLEKIILEATATTTTHTVAGGDVSSMELERKVSAEAPDEANSIVPWIIIGVIAVGIYAAYKAAAARRGPKF